MVADLLELLDRAEDETLLLDAVRILDPALQFLHLPAVEHGLLCGQVHVLHLFELLREIRHDGLVGLEPSEDERRDHAAEFLVAVFLGIDAAGEVGELL